MCALDQPDVSKFHVAFATCVGVAAAEFDRKVFKRAKSWPMKLLTFVIKPHGIMCAARKAVGIELRDCGYEKLDSTTAKFKYMFAEAVKFIAETSLC